MGFELLVDVDVDEGELGLAPVVVGAVVVVAEEGLLGFFVAALEEEPAGGFAEEEDANSEGEGWDALDGEAETPLVFVVPAAFSVALMSLVMSMFMFELGAIYRPKCNEEAPGDHCYSLAF